jgi:hypothetical protein
VSRNTRITLTQDERLALELSLEFYIRMGLGQVGEIARRLDLLHGERLTPAKRDRIRQLCDEMEEVLWGDAAPWRLEDTETSNYLLTAFLLDARLAGNWKGECWARDRLRGCGKLDQNEQQQGDIG